MAHYHEPPAALTKAQWERLRAAFEAVEQLPAFEILCKADNKPQRAGDLFSERDVRSRGQDRVNHGLREAKSSFVLSRVDDYTASTEVNGTTREDRMLALVRRPKKL